jgi:hypothetical protein
MSTLSTQLRLTQALGAVLNGDSVRHAAAAADLDRRTLVRRIEGVPTRIEVNEALQHLSKVQEEWLANWAITQGELGYPPKLYHFKLYAQRILYFNGVDQPLGKRWYNRFLRRNPSVRTSRTTSINYRRAEAATAENINIFFDRLDLPGVATIPPSNIWNVDEMGLMIGESDKDLIVGDALRKFITSKTSQNREWVSIIECSSATGDLLSPLILFAGKSCQQAWFPDASDPRYRNWLFEPSPKGWTNNEIAYKWLKGVFVPQTKPKDPQQWRLLILDGHKSHTTVEFMQECLVNRIWLCFLPAHTSHILQPNDLGLFAYVKPNYKRKLSIACLMNLESFPGKREFIEAYARAREEKGTKKHITAGWTATGIYPRARNKALDNRFVRSSISRNRNNFTPLIPVTPTIPVNAELHDITISTPRSSRDLNIIERNLRGVDPALFTPTIRLLFRKVGKALDDQIVQLSNTQALNQSLQHIVDKSNSKKRKAVHPAPNEDFVRLADVRRVRRTIEGFAQSSSEESSENSSIEEEEEQIELEDSEEDCIEVKDSDSESN